MAEPTEQPTAIAALALTLELAEGDTAVTPPRQLTTGMPGKTGEFRALRAEFEDAVKSAFGSSAALDRLRFTDVGKGTATARFSVIASEPEPLDADRYAGGITAVIDEAQGPFKKYLRAVTENDDLAVSVADALVEQAPSPSPAEPILTLKQQKLARWIAFVMLVVTAAYVLAVLYA